MKCPYCFREIPFSTVCPACGRELHFGGNTQFLAEVQQGRLGVKDIFAQTLKRHPKGDAFRSLTRRPALTAEMLETWQRPWMFLRLFVMLLIATVLLTFAAETMVYISPKLKMEFNFPLSVIANIVGSTVIPWTWCCLSGRWTCMAISPSLICWGCCLSEGWRVLPSRHRFFGLWSMCFRWGRSIRSHGRR